jgi:hypothetical protein
VQLLTSPDEMVVKVGEMQLEPEEAEETAEEEAEAEGAEAGAEAESGEDES